MAHFNSPCGLCLCELPVILQDFPVLLLGSLSVIDYVLQIRGVVSLIKNSFVVSLMKKKQKKNSFLASTIWEYFCKVSHFLHFSSAFDSTKVFDLGYPQ